jgi:hypothetical protein
MFGFPTGARDFSFLRNVHTGLGAHLGSYSVRTVGSFLPGVKRPDREAEQSPSSDNSDVKNECSYTPTYPTHMPS